MEDASMEGKNATPEVLPNEELCTQLAPDFSQRLNLSDVADVASDLNLNQCATRISESDTFNKSDIIYVAVVKNNSDKSALFPPTSMEDDPVKKITQQKDGVSLEKDSVNRNEHGGDCSVQNDNSSISTVPVSQVIAENTTETGAESHHYVCQCGKTFEKSAYLANHKRWACSLKEKKAQCAECKSWFASEGGLRRHMRQVHGGLSRCDKCGMRCRNNLHLTRHWLDAHCDDSQNNNILKCFKCDSTDFKDKYELECHWLRHKYDRRQKRLSDQPFQVSVSSESSEIQSTSSIASVPSSAVNYFDEYHDNNNSTSQTHPSKIEAMHHSPIPMASYHQRDHWYGRLSYPHVPFGHHHHHPCGHHRPHSHPPPPPLPPPPPFSTPHPRPQGPFYDKSVSTDSPQPFNFPSWQSRHDHAYVEPTTLSAWPHSGYDHHRHHCWHRGKMKWKKYLKLMMKGKVPPLWSGANQHLQADLQHPWANQNQAAKECRADKDKEKLSDFQIACKFCDKVIEKGWISWHQRRDCPVLTLHKCEVCGKVFQRRHLLLKHMHLENHLQLSTARTSNVHPEISSVTLSNLQQRMNDTLTLRTNVESPQPISELPERSHTVPLQQQQQAQRDRLDYLATNATGLSTDKGAVKQHVHYCSLCKQGFLSIDSLKSHLQEHLLQVESVQKVWEWRQRSVDFFEAGNSEDSFAPEESVSKADSEITSTTGSVITAGSSFVSGVTSSVSTDDRWMKPHSKGGSHHRKGEISICEFCGDHFAFQKDLELHMKEKHPKSKLQCPVCHKSFSWKKRGKFYERHLESHYGVKIFKHKCDHCEKTFLEKSKLVAHIAAKHTHEQIYKCGMCGKSYANKSSLVRHERQHTGDRPYKCSLCSQTFLEKRELLRHSATHTGVAPFSCDVCGQGFTLKTSLMAHKKNKHSDSGT